MERSFHADLRDVIVHDDPEASASTAARGMEAYTVGSHIYFRAGRLDPSSNRGRGLLAHEVTHVLQQRNGAHRSSAALASPSAPAEIEARGAAAQVAAGHTVDQVAVRSDVSLHGADSHAETATIAAPSAAPDGGGATLPATAAEGGLPPALEATIKLLDSTTLQSVLSAVLPSGIVPNLKKMKAFLLGAWAIWKNPNIVLDPIKASFAQMIDQVPGRADSAIAEATAKYGPAIGKHLSGIWRHLKPKLEYLKNNWWEVLKETGRGLLFPWEGMQEDIDKIGELFVTAKQEISSAHWSKAGDAVIDAWRAGNNLAGRWYGWFLLGMALIGGIVGAIFGAGVGFVPGVVAGAELAFAAGKILLMSTVAAEGGNLAKSLVEITSESETDDEREDDYERISSSGLTLAIIGVMFVVGEIAAKFVQWLFRRIAKALGKELPAPKPTATEAHAARQGKPSPSEFERAKNIREGYEKRDLDLKNKKVEPRTGPEDDLGWANDAHRKDLAYDPDAGHYRINEGRAAIAAEDSGVLEGPLRRAPKKSGADFLDAKGRLWSHKGGDLSEVVGKTVTDAQAGNNVLADLSDLSPAQQDAARAAILKDLKGQPGAADRVRFLPPAPPTPPSPVPANIGRGAGAVVGQQAAAHTNQPSH